MKSVFTLQEFATIYTIEDALLREGMEPPETDLHDITLTSTAKARAIANKYCMQFQNKSLDEVLPNFDQNYALTRKMTMKGIFSRKEMPVISAKDIENIQHFLKSGHADKDEKEAKVHATTARAKDLGPLQKQIYFEKGIFWIAKDGVELQTKKLREKRLVISKDEKVVDGHHRWLTGMLIDPILTLNIFQVDLKWQDLKDMMIKYSDFMGKKRNV